MPSKPTKKKATVAPKKKVKSKSKAKFTVQQLKAIHTALVADPATKKLADRVIDALHDPGFTEPPPFK